MFTYNMDSVGFDLIDNRQHQAEDCNLILSVSQANQSGNQEIGTKLIHRKNEECGCYEGKLAKVRHS